MSNKKNKPNLSEAEKKAIQAEREKAETAKKVEGQAKVDAKSYKNAPPDPEAEKEPEPEDLEAKADYDPEALDEVARALEAERAALEAEQAAFEAEKKAIEAEKAALRLKAGRRALETLRANNRAEQIAKIKPDGKVSKEKTAFFRAATPPKKKVPHSIQFMTAHRTMDGWPYGSHFPQYGEHYENGIELPVCKHYMRMVKLNRLEIVG